MKKALSFFLAVALLVPLFAVIPPEGTTVLAVSTPAIGDKIRVYFGSNGGSGTMSSIEIAAGSDYTLPPNEFIPPSEGSRFVGWALSSNGGAESSPIRKVMGNEHGALELYAIWNTPIIINPIGPDGTVSSSTSINLTDEIITIEPGFAVAAYSIDGGNKWKKGNLPSNAYLGKMFDKGMTLWLSDGWNSRNVRENGSLIEQRGLPSNARFIKFETIAPRPKKNTEKLKPYYPVDDEHRWMLGKSGANIAAVAVYSNYEYAPTSNGKTPDADWLSLPKGGMDIPERGTRAFYVVRNAATSVTTQAGNTYIPASAPFKVKPASYTKAPKYKFISRKDSNKNEFFFVSMKKGDCYAIGEEIEEEQYSAPVPGKFDLHASVMLELGGSTVSIKRVPTGKKPGSVAQILDLSTVSVVLPITVKMLNASLSVPQPVPGNPNGLPIFAIPDSTAYYSKSDNADSNKWTEYDNDDPANDTFVSGKYTHRVTVLSISLDANRFYTFTGLPQTGAAALFPGGTIENWVNTGTQLEFDVRYDLRQVITTIYAKDWEAFTGGPSAGDVVTSIIEPNAASKAKLIDSVSSKATVLYDTKEKWSATSDGKALTGLLILHAEDGWRFHVSDTKIMIDGYLITFKPSASNSTKLVFDVAYAT